MAQRRQELGRDTEGRYRRYLGWKQGNGRLVQHLFRLGRDKEQAERRNGRLEELWRCVEARHRRLRDDNQTTDPAALWDDVTLSIGAAVARGETACTVALPPGVEGTPAEQQLLWLYMLQRDFPGFTLRLPDTANVGPAVENLMARAEKAERGADLEAKIFRAVAVASAPAPGQTLHQALDAFSLHVAECHKMPDGRASPTCRLHQRQAKQIKEHQADMPLGSFGLAEIDGLVNYWRNRPLTKFGTPAAPDTVRDVIKRIKEFVRWLHRSPAFEWRKPEDLEWGRVRIPRNPVEDDLPDELPTYSIPELETLYEYASPFERLNMLLALNCGFGQAEILTLQKKSIKGDYIRRRRYKTGVYGEWKLWPETKAGIAWMLARHKGDVSSLLVTRAGRAIEYVTPEGNRAQHIANAWKGLTARIRKKDFPTFPQLSFNKLKKTATSEVRKIAGGEVAGLFVCHGRVVEDDLLEEYAARHFPPVHEAIDAWRARLAGMFAEVSDPFPASDKKSNPSLSLGTIRRMREMRAQGFKVARIAEECGVCRDTVRRHLKQA
jgi:hypothetical protein